MSAIRQDDGEALQQRAIAVIKPLIPPDAYERVVRAHKEFRNIVRSHIRAETRLSFVDEETRENVPVKIVDGFPVGIAQLIDKYQDRTLWRLILGLPKLGGIVDGLSSLVTHWMNLKIGWSCRPKPKEVSLRSKNPSPSRRRFTLSRSLRKCSSN
jgi:hypothetical protein